MVLRPTCSTRLQLDPRAIWSTLEFGEVQTSLPSPSLAGPVFHGEDGRRRWRDHMGTRVSKWPLNIVWERGMRGELCTPLALSTCAQAWPPYWCCHYHPSAACSSGPSCNKPHVLSAAVWTSPFRMPMPSWAWGPSCRSHTSTCTDPGPRMRATETLRDKTMKAGGRGSLEGSTLSTEELIKLLRAVDMR